MDNKKRGFFNFSLQRKIITAVLLIMFAVSAVVSFFSLNQGAGQAFWSFFPFIYFFALFTVTYNLYNLKKILKKAYKPLIIIFYSGMILFFTVFTVFCVLILGYSSEDIPENPDLAIVLGCQTYGYKPSSMLKSRLDKSVEVLNEYPNLFCIVSGGQGPDETVPESAAMKKYLIDNGIDESRIYEESESSSSIENLILSKKIITDNNLKNENTIIITNEFHIPRSIMIAKRIYADSDVKVFAIKAESPFPIIFPMFNPGIVREFFAFVKSYIFDRVEL